MSAPHKFLRKLQDVIVAEATDAMAEWMNRTEEKLDELRADVAELRQVMDARFAKAEAAAAQRHSDFMKWTMGFWAVSLVTYVGALVALANVLK